jgi:hypothetical protein
VTRPVRSLVSLVPVAGAAGLWTGTLDNGVQVEISGQLILRAAADLRPVAVSPRTITSDLRPTRASVDPKVPVEAPSGERYIIADGEAFRVADLGQVHHCSVCKAPGHKSRTCPTLGLKPSAATVQRSATLRRQRARALVGAAKAGNGGDGA